MKRYTIVAKETVNIRSYYTVIATSEEEAMEKYFDGNYDTCEHGEIFDIKDSWDENIIDEEEIK